MKVLFQGPSPTTGNSPFDHLKKDIYIEFQRAGIDTYRVVPVYKGREPKDVLPLDNEPASMSYEVLTVPYIANKSFFMRYIKSMLLTFLVYSKGLRNKDVDVVVSILPQAAIIPILLAKMKHKKTVVMLMDIWPNNASEIGAISKNSFIYKLFFGLQKKVYKHADAIITISEDMKKTIEDAGTPGGKIFIAHNWSYLDKKVNIEWSENEFAREFKLEKNVFRVVYAGNIGAMQNVEMIIDAAIKLKDTSDIRFVIVGDGINKKKIIGKVQENDLQNIDFYPYQTNDMATHIYALADINIIPLRKGAIHTALPSKTAVCLSCGRPIIACIDKDSHFAKMLSEHGAAKVVEPDDAEELVQAILKLKDNDDLYAEMGRAAQEFYEDGFRRAENVKVYSRVVKKVYENHFRIDKNKE